MTFNLFHLGLLLLGFAYASYFYSALRVREFALIAARRHCNDMKVQLLDQSVSANKIWLKRDGDGQLHVWRNYQFEFTSTGGERYFGNVITLGKQVIHIQLEAHRLPSDIDQFEVQQSNRKSSETTTNSPGDKNG